MQISVAYSEPNDQAWITLEVPEGITVQEAIQRSGILERFPHINLATCKVGIFGKLTRLDAHPQPGDRIEIYRPLIADPKTVPRRRAIAHDEEE
ncbi:MAG: RnfH family protein [Hydrogenophilus sp.]|nr:RnfH family protein [Hydrogenophilus sp.]